ncbi:MAG: molybdate ABC transporter substrate-binding protein [Luteimonas sp.]|nr:molybdate ABC transporter substrate-binding protein [Luteimonas sp.]
MFALLALCLVAAGCGERATTTDEGSTPAADTRPLTVFAAASLKESLDAAADAWREQTGQTVQVSYAASSALARQIEQLAPADVFLSADSEWMDWLQERDLIDPASRVDLLGNTLVLIALANSDAQPLALAHGTDLLPLLGNDGRIALAMTASVPAGKYAKAAFESLGTWSAIEPRVAEAENVRAALLLVARGETPLGVVYGSDAQAEPRVKVLATFPEGSHSAIVYPVARVASGTHPAAGDFIAWLQSENADAIFRRHGFSLR